MHHEVGGRRHLCVCSMVADILARGLRAEAARRGKGAERSVSKCGRQIRRAIEGGAIL